MKLLRIELRPFAGFRDKAIAFEPGVNVVLGPNDVGKSSLFRALESALFLPVKVSRSTKEGKETLPRVLPLGGDHARLALDFESAGKKHRLEKSWGAQGASSLEAEDGAKVILEEKVEEWLRALLPAQKATFQSVLLLGQGALEGTVAALERSREALHSLGDLLRVSLDQAGGVSVERLKARLEAEIKKCFSHWDLNANLPEKGKGIEDEWKRDVGSVLAAFYEKERFRRAARGALETETERDRKLADLSRLREKRDEARAFVQRNEKFVRSASEREALEARVAKARAEADTMVKDLSAWMQAESDRKNFAPEVAHLSEREKKLVDELQGALAAGKRKEAAGKLERARVAHSRLAEARKTLAALPVMRAEDLRRYRAALAEVEKLRNQVKPSKVQLQFHARRDLDVAFRKDFEAERKGTMTAGKSMTVNAGSRIQLSSELFELHVTTGEGSLAELEEALARANDLLGKVQSELKVQSLEEAEARQEKYAEAALAVKSAEGALPPEKLEDLEKLAGASPAEGLRDAELVQAELQALRRDLAGKRDGLVRSESLLKNLEQRHGLSDSAALTNRMVERKGELADLERKLAAMPQLPPETGAIADFLPRYKRAELEAGTLTEEIATLQVAIAELNARLPEQSAQDLERAHREADEAFQRELSRGRALLRVRDAVAKAEGGGGDTYSGFREEFARRVKELSAGKYVQAAMDEALPTEFRRADGADVPYGWLSAGTKDAFALALRLSMAAHFLGKADGFLLLDDPFVNMDPERQKIAAALLRDFARERQVVLFTCHPAHAELLGGHRISL